jgi:hypothetical protein
VALEPAYNPVPLVVARPVSSIQFYLVDFKSWTRINTKLEKLPLSFSEQVQIKLITLRTVEIVFQLINIFENTLVHNSPHLPINSKERRV